MANPCMFATQQPHLTRLFNRGSIVSDIDGNYYYISCSKHPEIRQPAVKVGLEQDTLSELERAFDNCSGCVDEERTAKQWAATKFPEGAEL